MIFFAWFTLSKKESKKDEIDEENLLQITRISFLDSNRGLLDIIIWMKE